MTRLLTVLALMSAAAAAADAPPVLHHDARVTLELDGHRLAVVDAVTLPAGVEELLVGADLEILSPEAPARAVEREGRRYRAVDLAAAGFGAGDVVTFRLEGSLHQPTDQARFSREDVGGEITATIGEQGVYLSAVAGWLPFRDGVLATHRVEVTAPEGFVSVTQGRPEAGAAPHVTTWVAEHPSDGLNLVANRFVVHEQEVRPGLSALTYFLEDDARLRATYLERTAAYLAMYEEMFGPYPYAKFATVENWFPTGYGMPGWTLLGGQVLRLPFIPYTSFGHEIAHNWWGNSVFVDIAGGNWCEGLTVWCADHHYEELESPAAAREYRRNLLKDYAAYVRDPEQDFALREFASRHSGATRAVGYGKSMMVFHMLDRMLGRETFLNALRDVYARFRFRQASWEDLIAACASAGGRDLAWFAPQWLDRVGAPHLALEEVDFGADRVEFVLRQGAPPYRLEVPVAVATPDGPVREVIAVEHVRQPVRLDVRGATALTVDPDHDVFRHLHPGEIEPTLSRVLAEDEPMVVAFDPDVEDAARAFADAWTEGGYYDLFVDGRLPPDLPRESYPATLVINPTGAAGEVWGRPEVAVAGNTIVLEGQRYRLDAYDLVYATENPYGPGVSDLVVHTAATDRLPALARRLGHYGRYSWLLLPAAGSGRVLRGNWRPAGSPLTASAP